MAEQRIIIEMGMGNDLHGMDYTKAALRAIEDAFRHSSLPIFGVLDLPHDAMRVQVTVAVQAPEQLDLAVDANGETIVIAQAAVEAFLPPQTGWRVKR